MFWFSVMIFWFCHDLHDLFHAVTSWWLFLLSGKMVSRSLIFKPCFQTWFNFWSKNVSRSTQIRRVLSAEGNENTSVESLHFYHKNSSVASLIQLLSHKRSSTIQLSHLRISCFCYIAILSTLHKCHLNSGLVLGKTPEVPSKTEPMCDDVL